MSAVAWTLGAQPVIVASPADGAERLRIVAAILRGHPDPAAQEHARALDQFDAEGGDLNELCGVKVRRGGAYDVPAKRRRLRERNDALRALAATLPGGPTAQANAIVAMRRDHDPKVLVIHASTEALPASLAQVKRILRGA